MSKKFIGALITLGIVVVLLVAGGTFALLSDTETSTGNQATAWTSSLWTQTSQVDFNAGVLNNVDTSSSPGDVKLAAINGWYGTGWSYRKQITVDHTKVSNTSQSNFTILISRIDPTLEYTGNGGHVGQSDGGDILFTSSDGITKLSHEIEKYVPSTGELVAWVKVPTLSTTADTIIYMYYGNSGCADQWNINGTWDSTFNGIWHLKEDPSGAAPQMKDSTTNGNNGTSGGSMTSANQVAGKIDGSLYFNGSSNYVQVNDSASLRIGSAITVSAWIYPYSVATGSHRIISKWTALNQEYILYLSGTQIGVGVKTGFGVTTGANLVANTWYHIEMVWSGSNPNTIAVYENGSPLPNVTITTGTTGTSGPLVIAKHGSASSEYFNGIIDECRVSMTSRSADWIKTEYNNQNSPSTFYSAGIEGGQYVSSGTIASQVFDTAKTGSRLDGMVWDATLPANTTLTFAVRASDTLFAASAATPAWTSIGTSPVLAGLPSGRYFQWRATLTTTLVTATPTLSEARTYYYHG
jgi:predicted ribosomally synthesized peptide with SipW-like signal peptide